MLSTIRRLLYVVFFFIPCLLVAQRNTPHELGLDGLYPAEAVNTFDLRERTTIKQAFLNEEWMTGMLISAEGDVSKKEFLVKYDFLNQELNVNISQVAYVAPNSAIGGFILKGLQGTSFEDRKFVFDKPKGWKKRKTFFEIIETGAIELRMHYYAEKLKPNYIPALDVGDINEKIVKKNYHYLKDKNGFFKIPTKKKAAIKFFQAYPRAKTYLKKNKVNFKKTEDLKKLVQFMNLEKNT